ncbi:MAG: hypothetical protein JW840_10085 [Candidatus Thermoplasmatota archaeon]|nr:hypothetical protein [Candidatus Thermoplasmatota archaeon]
MNSRKMNNYSLMRVSTTFILTFALVVSTVAIPLGAQTSAQPLENNPPNVPSNPDPENNSMNVNISVLLKWSCDDPDGDPLTYNVYFGSTSPPELVSENQTNASYEPETLEYATPYYWMITAWDNQSASTQGPEWTFTTEAGENQPPYVPSTPAPSNNSINMSVYSTLNWNGGDPDEGDVVVYDVYLGTTTNPLKKAENLSDDSYDPPEPLSYGTLYYWRIVARDNHGAETTGPLWHFTTKENGGNTTNITVTFVKPRTGKLYFNDNEIGISLPRNTIVYGKITITINVTSDSEIIDVKFFVDDKPISDEDSDSNPYTCLWQPIIQFNSALSLKRNLRVVVTDSENKTANATLDITKWRFHILPFVIAGAAFASRLVLHTTVTGVFLNFRESRFSVSFYALRAHYKTIGPFKTQRGVLNFKKCTGGMLIGPTSTTRLGLFHKFMIGSFTFIGNIHTNRLGLGQALISGILERRLSRGDGLSRFLPS